MVGVVCGDGVRPRVELGRPIVQLDLKVQHALIELQHERHGLFLVFNYLYDFQDLEPGPVQAFG